MTSTTSQSSSGKHTHVKPVDDEAFRQKVIHYTSWACLISGPILIALPPRKLDLYTFGLLLCTFVGGNEVSRQQTGISMINRIGQRLTRSMSVLPPQALDLQKRAREERERSLHDLEKWRTKNGTLDSSQQTTNLSPSLPSHERISKQNSSFWKNIWMGGEGENWKEERLRREKDALSSGKGYFDLIQEQIQEVWNRNKHEPDDKRGIVREHDQSNEDMVKKDNSDKKMT